MSAMLITRLVRHFADEFQPVRLRDDQRRDRNLLHANVSQINPGNRKQQVNTMVNRRSGRPQLVEIKKTYPSSGDINWKTKTPITAPRPQTGYENWQAMSYPEYVAVLQRDATIQGLEQNIAAWLIRCAVGRYAAQENLSDRVCGSDGTPP